MLKVPVLFFSSSSSGIQSKFKFSLKFFDLALSVGENKFEFFSIGMFDIFVIFVALKPEIKPTAVFLNFLVSGPKQPCSFVSIIFFEFVFLLESD